MNKFIYVLRILFQAVIIAGIYFLYCSNANGTFTLRLDFVFGWLILSLISQIYLMRFPGLYPISKAVAEEKGEYVGEFNLFVAVGLFLAYAFLGPLVAVGFYFWDRRLSVN